MITGRLYRACDRTMLIERVYRTVTAMERMRGLLCRPRLQEHEALLIKPCSSVHTIGMKYTIDLAFLDHNWTVVKAVHALKPWRMAGCAAALMVLEIAENGLYKLQLTEGLQLEWREEQGQ